MLLLFILLAADPQTQWKDDPNWVRPVLVGSASDSGHFHVDDRKLRAMFPGFNFSQDHVGAINDHLDRGDSRAALVASIEPLVVSCYSDELDAVILVEFPAKLAQQYELKAGDKLIASWTYPRRSEFASDIEPGESYLGRQKNGIPYVADFFSDSQEKIARRKAGVSDAEWKRTRELTGPALRRAAGKYRSAFPLETHLPPDGLTRSPFRE